MVGTLSLCPFTPVKHADHPAKEESRWLCFLSSPVPNVPEFSWTVRHQSVQTFRNGYLFIIFYMQHIGEPHQAFGQIKLCMLWQPNTHRLIMGKRFVRNSVLTFDRIFFKLADNKDNN